MIFEKKPVKFTFYPQLTQVGIAGGDEPFGVTFFSSLEEVILEILKEVGVEKIDSAYLSRSFRYNLEGVAAQPTEYIIDSWIKEDRIGKNTKDILVSYENEVDNITYQYCYETINEDPPANAIFVKLTGSICGINTADIPVSIRKINSQINTHVGIH